MVMKLFPAVASISIFKYLGVFFQLIVLKFPIVLLASASPMTTANNPCALVVTFLISEYSIEPVALPCKILKRKLICCEASITLLLVRATP